MKLTKEAHIYLNQQNLETGGFYIRYKNKFEEYCKNEGGNGLEHETTLVN